MPVDPPAADQMLVAVSDTDAYVRIVGRGSFKIAPALQQFGRRIMDQGARRLTFDLAACVNLDSTIMGVIAGLASRLKQQGGDGVRVARCPPRIEQLLSTLGLDRVVQILPPDADALPAAEAAPLPAGGAGHRETAETMLQAHEELTRLDPQNDARFRDVLQYLREELSKDTPLS